LPAICRAPAANPVYAVYQIQPSRLTLLPLRGRSRDKPRSYRDRGVHAARPTPRRLRLACTRVAFGGVWAIASEKQNQKPVLNMNQDVRRAFDSAEGVGARLPAICRAPAANPIYAVYQIQPSRLTLPLRGRSRDKPRSYRDRGIHAARPTPRRLRLACTRVAFGGVWAIALEKQNQKPVLNMSQDVRRAFDSAEGVGARLPAICRAPAANPMYAVYQIQPSRLTLLPLRGRSRDKPRSYISGDVSTIDDRIKNARSVSSSPRCSCTRQSRHRKTRLGCRPNAGDAEWVERHGCRESAVRTWMSVRRAPTERRRSAGTRRSRAQPGAGHFWLLLVPFQK
jgi:hypothetical protein